MNRYPVFTVSYGDVEPGAKVEPYAFSKHAQVPAIVVGEGKTKGAIEVILTGYFRKCKDICGTVMVHHVTIRDLYNKVTLTPYIEKEDLEYTHCVVVLPTPIGYNGLNYHTGKQGEDGDYTQFPGIVLAHGKAGNPVNKDPQKDMGIGDQYIALIPANQVFVTHYINEQGDMWGFATEHFYCFNGKTLVSWTMDQCDIVEY
jgi:hypothetical protein